LFGCLLLSLEVLLDRSVLLHHALELRGDLGLLPFPARHLREIDPIALREELQALDGVLVQELARGDQVADVGVVVDVLHGALLPTGRQEVFDGLHDLRDGGELGLRLLDQPLLRAHEVELLERELRVLGRDLVQVLEARAHIGGPLLGDLEIRFRRLRLCGFFGSTFASGAAFASGAFAAGFASGLSPAGAVVAVPFVLAKRPVSSRARVPLSSALAVAASPEEEVDADAFPAAGEAGSGAA
jgi:hypothetical protein